MATKYSVFISSTFEDLREERRAVQDTVIEAGDFPVQMESFPASDDAAFDLITSLLDQCDYYVLIIGGRYGAIADDGLSYTHKEYRYAVERQIPVLVMLHGQRGQITSDKTELTDTGKRLLEAFIEEVSATKTRKTWTSVGELRASVMHALVNAKLTKPRVGWVRGDTISSVEVLSELNEVRKENEKFREALGQLEVEIPSVQLPSIDSEVEIEFLPNRPRRSRLQGASGTVATTWMPLFPIVHQNLKWSADNFEGQYWIDVQDSCVTIGSALVQEVSDTDTQSYFKISRNTLARLTSYYIEIGLMHPEGDQRPFPELANKIARRHQFANVKGPQFILRRGTTAIHEVDSDHPSDDIPF
ncbi:DUF4062 domain-containing protein [Mesorhizobium sp. LNHC229A00]|uniref:DUF4062 domain-containing protein n=1 Tax=Mesorhizobium sp. LNHC229A00 TaxID=1287240 RepID=UPI0006880B5F|nr:DUF4062 domain-containing protein [Mesorhizobium sp. LNHC229A00]